MSLRRYQHRVQVDNPRAHRFYGVMMMAQKYAATYKFGKATVHVVAPPPMTQEAIDKVLADYHQAAWELWNTIPVEERLRINAEAEKAKDEQPNPAA